MSGKPWVSPLRSGSIGWPCERQTETKLEKGRNSKVSKSHIDALVHAAYFGPRDVRALPQQPGHLVQTTVQGLPSSSSKSLRMMDSLESMMRRPFVVSE